MIPDMFKVREFNNRLIGDWLEVWGDQAARFPEFLAPVTRQVLELQILGNSLFDPAGFLIAYDGKTPIGVIHAAFGPNPSGSDLSRLVGILYPPVIRTDVPVDRGRAAQELIEAAEAYFHAQGTRRWYAGGYANSSPFYTGLYGWTNPVGICDDDVETVEILHRLGYRPCGVSRRFRLVCAPYRPVITPKIQQADNEVVVTRFVRQSEPSWWEANIYRNFETEEWNVLPRDAINDDPIAGAVFRQMSPTFTPRGEIEQDQTRYILDYIAVVETRLRCGIASLLLTVALSDIARLHGEFIVDTVVDVRDTRMASFLLASQFTEVGTVSSFFKVVS